MRQQMQYRIIAGRTVETRRGLFSIGPTYRKPRGTRRAGASSLKKIKANEKSCILNCARKINCNFRAGDVFLTLKYDDAHYPEDLSYEQAEADVKKFLRRVRSEYRKAAGEKLRAVWVTANWSPEHQAPARLHQHAVGLCRAGCLMVGHGHNLCPVNKGIALHCLQSAVTEAHDAHMYHANGWCSKLKQPFSRSFFTHLKMICCKDTKKVCQS